ncbi:TFIIE alpha subunit-domain-containing protein [Dipodascopsis uninucleata]
MEHVKTLIQLVSRSFYETRHIIILDAILKHVVISDDDLPHMVGIQKKELHKLTAKLREDRLLKIFTRSEAREGQQRPVQKTYYYIHHRETVDAVKWKIHKLGEIFNDQMRNDVDRQGYVCPLCHRRYSALDVLPLQAADLSGFVCADCGSILRDDDNSDEVKFGQERLARLMSQIRKIIDTLKKIDDVFIPDNDFESSLKQAVPTNIESRDNSNGTIPYAQRGNNRTSLSLQVDLTSGEPSNPENSSSKISDTALKNALPIWHLESTIGGGNSNGNKEEVEAPSAPSKPISETSVKQQEAAKNTVTEQEVDKAIADSQTAEFNADAEDVIAAYYNSLNAQQDAEDFDEDDDEEEEEEEENDDGEFEEMESF